MNQTGLVHIGNYNWLPLVHNMNFILAIMTGYPWFIFAIITGYPGLVCFGSYFISKVSFLLLFVDLSTQIQNLVKYFRHTGLVKNWFGSYWFIMVHTGSYWFILAILTGSYWFILVHTCSCWLF